MPASESLPEPKPEPLNCDLWLRNGLIMDGLGRAAFEGDVAVRNGKIVATGMLSDVRARHTLDVQGLIIAPGFIDVHAHDDLVCITKPHMTPKISQGVTTVVVGNCGLSAAPLRFEGAIVQPMDLLGDTSDFAYDSFADYVRAIEDVGPCVNVAALVGHTTLRIRCMADLSRPATADERAAMAALLETALDDGAVGLSSGVFYAPAEAADDAELIHLAEVVARKGGVYTAHIRNEGDHIIPALEEAFGVARSHKVPLILSHHKCTGLRNWGRSVETLGLIDRTRQSQSIHLDTYPYTAGSTIIREDLADSEVDILINWSTPHPEMAGRRLKTIAAEWGCSEPEAMRRMVPGGASYFQVNEDDLRRIMAHPCCMIGSDGLPNDPRPHPRLWGAFPRVLGHYVRDVGLMSLEAAVHKMTGQAAQTFGLTDRGVVAEGFAADLTVFDPAAVAEGSSYESPTLPARGIAHVFVNGAMAWSDGKPAGSGAGRFLRRPATL